MLEIKRSKNNILHTWDHLLYLAEGKKAKSSIRIYTFTSSIFFSHKFPYIPFLNPNVKIIA